MNTPKKSSDTSEIASSSSEGNGQTSNKNSSSLQASINQSPISASITDLCNKIGDFDSELILTTSPRNTNIGKLHRLFYATESAIDTLQTTSLMLEKTYEEAQVEDDGMGDVEENTPYTMTPPELSPQKNKRSRPSPSADKIRKFNISVGTFTGIARTEAILCMGPNKISSAKKDKLIFMKEQTDHILKNLRNKSEAIEKKMGNDKPEIIIFNLSEMEEKTVKMMRQNAIDKDNIENYVNSY